MDLRTSNNIKVSVVPQKLEETPGVSFQDALSFLVQTLKF